MSNRNNTPNRRQSQPLSPSTKTSTSKGYNMSLTVSNMNNSATNGHPTKLESKITSHIHIDLCSEDESSEKSDIKLNRDIKKINSCLTNPSNDIGSGAGAPGIGSGGAVSTGTEGRKAVDEKVSGDSTVKHVEKTTQNGVTADLKNPLVNDKQQQKVDNAKEVAVKSTLSAPSPSEVKMETTKNVNLLSLNVNSSQQQQQREDNHNKSVRRNSKEHSDLLEKSSNSSVKEDNKTSRGEHSKSKSPLIQKIYVSEQQHKQQNIELSSISIEEQVKKMPSKERSPMVRMTRASSAHRKMDEVNVQVKSKNTHQKSTITPEKNVANVNPVVSKECSPPRVMETSNSTTTLLTPPKTQRLSISIPSATSTPEKAQNSASFNRRDESTVGENVSKIAPMETDDIAPILLDNKDEQQSMQIKSKEGLGVGISTMLENQCEAVSTVAAGGTISQITTVSEVPSLSLVSDQPIDVTAVVGETKHKRALRFTQISGRRSIHPLSELSPSIVRTGEGCYRESYRRINTELDTTNNTSLNVTVGSEPPNNSSLLSSFSFFGRGRKRERQSMKQQSNETHLNKDNGNDDQQEREDNDDEDMDVSIFSSPPKRPRMDFFSVVCSPMTLLRRSLERTNLKSSTPMKTSSKQQLVEKRQQPAKIDEEENEENIENVDLASVKKSMEDVFNVEMDTEADRKKVESTECVNIVKKSEEGIQEKKNDAEEEEEEEGNKSDTNSNEEDDEEGGDNEEGEDDETEGISIREIPLSGKGAHGKNKRCALM